MKPEGKKARRELKIFRLFAAVASTDAGVRIDLGSIKNELPPKPDISCTIDGERHYFELREIVDAGLARITGTAIKEMRITVGSFSQDEPLLNAFSVKSTKKYDVSDGKLELLAYYEKQSPPPEELLGRSTLTTLYWKTEDMTTLGPWYRLWIYDVCNKRILAVYPS
jgi:hypothetical protein